MYQGLKIKPCLSLNTPLLVLAAPFQVSPASSGKHVPTPSTPRLLRSSEDCFWAGRYPRAYRIHNSGEQPRRERAPGTNAAAASASQGAEEGAGSRFTVQAAVWLWWKQEWKAGTASSRPNKHCIHMQSYGANDLSVVHLENRFHQPGLNDYVAAACASCCFWR